MPVPDATNASGGASESAVTPTDTQAAPKDLPEKSDTAKRPGRGSHNDQRILWSIAGPTQNACINYKKIDYALKQVNDAKKSAAASDARKQAAKTIDMVTKNIAAARFGDDNEKETVYISSLDLAKKELEAAKKSQKAERDHLSQTRESLVSLVRREMERCSHPDFFSRNPDDLKKLGDEIEFADSETDRARDISEAIHSAQLAEVNIALKALSKTIKAQEGKLSPQQERAKEAIIAFAVSCVIEPRVSDGFSSISEKINQVTRLLKWYDEVKKDVDEDLLKTIYAQCLKKCWVPEGN